MGWTGIYCAEIPQDNKGNYKIKEYLDKEFGHEIGEKYTWDILKSVMVGTTWFGAIKKTDNETGESEVYAEIILTRKDGVWFNYKEMSEKAGPFYYNCPNSILKLLTPTDSKYAQEWREGCKKHQIETKLRKQIRDLVASREVSTIKYYNEDHTCMFLYYGKYMYHGKLTQCWRNDEYQHVNFSKLRLDRMILHYRDGKRGAIENNMIVSTERG